MPENLGHKRDVGQVELGYAEKTQNNGTHVRQTSATQARDGNEEKDQNKAHPMAPKQEVGQFPEIRGGQGTERNITHHTGRIRTNRDDYS